MPRTPEFTAKYRDALSALTAATGRPTTVINVGGSYAIRVEFELNRYLIATNSDHGLGDDPDATGSWRICAYEHDSPGESDRMLVDVSDTWLIDALDHAAATLGQDSTSLTVALHGGEPGPPPSTTARPAL